MHYAMGVYAPSLYVLLAPVRLYTLLFQLFYKLMCIILSIAGSSSSSLLSTCSTNSLQEAHDLATDPVAADSSPSLENMVDSQSSDESITTPSLEDSINNELVGASRVEDAPLIEDEVDDEFFDASGVKGSTLLFEDGVENEFVEASGVENECDQEERSYTVQTDGEKSNTSETQSSQLNTPLYPGASISLHAALILILAFVVNHKLSNEALEDLLSLLGTLSLPSNILPITPYMFYKYLNIKQSDILRHHFCPACSIPLDEGDTQTCPNPACTRVFSSKSELSYFRWKSIFKMCSADQDS